MRAAKCNKIQNLQPPTSIEHHGCPFKIYSDDKLRQLLYEMKSEAFESHTHIKTHIHIIFTFVVVVFH